MIIEYRVNRQEVVARRNAGQGELSVPTVPIHAVQAVQGFIRAHAAR